MSSILGSGGPAAGVPAGARLEWVDPAEVTSAWQRMVRVFPFDPPDPDDPAVSDAELLGMLRDTEALVAQATAQQARALRELRARRVSAQAELSGHPGRDCPSSACCDPDGWLAPEVVAEVGLSDSQVRGRLELAERLARHPAIENMLDTGGVQAWTASRLLEHLHTLGHYVGDAQLAHAEAATLAWLAAKQRTVTQLNARMRRLIQLARAAARHDTDPDGHGGGVPEPGHARRRVVITPGGTPGVAELWALLPEADALAIKATLAALGHDRSDPHDPRSADQRRADLLHTLITGGVALHGRPTDTTCARRDPVDLQVRLDVTIPADSLTTDGVTPGQVPGYGDIPATTTRNLAGTSGCQARPLVYDPTTGRLLGFGPAPVRMTWLADLPVAPGYQHPVALDTAVKLRDGTCRAPGCPRRAARCDCDHVVPYPAGPDEPGELVQPVPTPPPPQDPRPRLDPHPRPPHGPRHLDDADRQPDHHRARRPPTPRAPRTTRGPQRPRPAALLTGSASAPEPVLGRCSRWDSNPHRCRF